MKNVDLLLLAFLLSLVFLLGGCTNSPRRSADRAALLQLHQDSLRAHREGDWRWFGRGTTDDVVMGSRGEIIRPNPEDTLARFRDYLGRTRFEEYRDASAPIVRVSDDGTMGWVLAHVYVKGVQDEGEETETRLDTTWTWISTFDKRDGRWLRAAMVSNMHEGPPRE